MSDILLAISCTVFFISMSVMITLHFRPLYYWDIDYLELEGQTGLTREEIQANYDAIIDYNCIGSGEDLSLPTMPLSSSASVHFQEVKRIFNVICYLGIAAFIISFVGIILKIRKSKWTFLKFTSIFNIAIPSALGTIIFINWDSFFITFHKLFFRNDNWLFDPDEDPVINILPDTFFLHCALFLAALILFSSLLCGIVYRVQKQKCKVR